MGTSRPRTMFVLFTVALLTGVGLAADHLSSDYQLGIASTTWPAVEGEITSSRLVRRSRTRRRPSRLEAQIWYRYAVRGVDYQGNRVGVFQAIGDRELVRRHRPGTRVRVYVDPQDPQRAVLYPGVNGWIVGFVVLLAAGVIGVIGRGFILAYRERAAGPR